MTTNQMMTIQIGNFGTLEIGHLTQMGKVSQVIEMENSNRRAKGLNEIPLEEILRKQELWEFIIARNNQKRVDFNSGKFPELKNSDNKGFSQSDYSSLKLFINPNGSIKYSDLMKNFPDLITSKRGKYGGTWAELYILLKIASMLDKDLEVRIYQVFINQKILFWRDLGGDNFKEFNKIVDTLPDRVGENNRGIYIQIATLLRQKLEILDTRGYNEKEHNSLIQETRAEWLKSLTFAIKVGLIKDVTSLKEIIKKL